MGKFNENLVRRGIAYHNRLRKEKEQRTERVPSKLLYGIRRDLEENNRSPTTNGSSSSQR